MQQHVCFEGFSCRRKAGVCRFGYPKQVRSETLVKKGECVDGTPTLTIECKRNNDATNNYCAEMLRVWRANMDIKLIGNVYGAAEYTAAYSSKAEPDTIHFRKAIAKCISNASPETPYYGILKKLHMLKWLTIYFSEICQTLGNQENVLKVKTTRHDRRLYRINLDSNADTNALQIMENQHSVVPPRIKLEPLEIAYMGRPREDPFDSMCYRKFAEGYEVSLNEPNEKQRLRQ